MKGFVYILKSQKNKSYYIGSSINPEQRFERHNKGNVKYTSNLTPWKLVFMQEYNDISIARKVEYKLKKLKRKDIVERIINEGAIKIK